ncbi:MAG: hypothetical protein EOO45_13055, partial [Flavobacterium sp.]
MKKHLLILITIFASLSANAQSRGIRIGYIDMDYILEKVPDFAEAKNQLEQKAGRWKQEIEVKKTEITKLKEGLKTEKVLLTKELIEEREEEIAFMEKELMDYQEKRFGPKGDLISQKAVLVKPIQDQVFTAVQEISADKYDFVFDKSSDLTMLFAAQRHDISDQVIRRLTRASKREQLSSKEVKKLEAAEAKEDLMDDPEYAERQKKLEDKKTAREKALEDRKAAREARVQEAAAKREQQKLDREARRNGTSTTSTATPPATTTTTNAATPASGNTNTQDGLNGSDDPVTTPAGTNANRPASTTAPKQPVNNEPVQGDNAAPVKTTATETPSAGDAAVIERQNAAQASKEAREAKLAERKRLAEERKKEREAAKKAR